MMEKEIKKEKPNNVERETEREREKKLSNYK